MRSRMKSGRCRRVRVGEFGVVREELSGVLIWVSFLAELRATKNSVP